MEALVLLLLLFAIFLIAMVRGALEEKRRKKAYREKLRTSYGNFPDREYSNEELESIPQMFYHIVDEYYVDDITWNDLSMDQIYSLINHTQSSSGAEYLYYMLRKPKLNEEEFENLESDIEYLSENEELRLDLQMLLHEIGRTGKYSLYDYIDFLENLGVRKNTKHIFCVIALIISIALINVNSVVGAVAVIVVMCYNVVQYLSEKKEILPYITTISYIMRLTSAIDGILSHDLHGMNKYKSNLAGKSKRFAGFNRNSNRVIGLNAMADNPIALVIEYIKMVTHFDLMMFNKSINFVQENKEDILGLVKDIGYIDAVISIGAFRASLPYYAVPELTEGLEVEISIEEGYHPAITEPVANSICQHRGMLVTGSNASGKSTFLKMAAINSLLAQTINTCAAKSYKGGYYMLYSSMSLRDNLESGESYYMVEIKALKRIIDVASEITKNPLLCFVDEVLRGTNTVERIAASTQIMKSLARNGVYCFAATHDIELTHLLEEEYDNYHFEEEVKNGDVLFSYRLLNGRAHTRNAIRLLEMIGFTEDIIKNADSLAAHFLKTGEWK